MTPRQRVLLNDLHAMLVRYDLFSYWPCDPNKQEELWFSIWRIMRGIS